MSIFTRTPIEFSFSITALLSERGGSERAIKPMSRTLDIAAVALRAIAASLSLSFGDCVSVRLDSLLSFASLVSPLADCANEGTDSETGLDIHTANERKP